MSVAAAAGYAQYADAGIKFIPQLYAPATLVKYYAKSVVPAISNTRYEGQIKDKGDKVIIRTRPNITIRNYNKGQKLTREVPQSAPLELNIDKAKYYDFVIDDVDEKQADIVLDDEFTSDSAEQMRIAIDTDVLGTVYAQAHARNQGKYAGMISGDGAAVGYDLGVAGDPLAVTKVNIIDVLTSIGTVLDEQNVPEEGRWVVLPAWARYLMVNSDLKSVSMTGDPKSPVRNGLVGMVDRLTIYMSNLLSVVDDASGVKATHIIAGQSDALTFAAQLVKNENLRCSDTFGWEYRGLQVYGYKVVKPEGLVHLYAYKG